MVDGIWNGDGRWYMVYNSRWNYFLYSPNFYEYMGTIVFSLGSKLELFLKTYK